MSESELTIPPNARVNFLTLHLADLQSVRMLPFFLTIAVLPLADRIWSSSARVLIFGSYAWLALLFVWFGVTSRYLRERFGSSQPVFVLAKEGPLRRGSGSLIALVLIVLGVSIYCILRGGMQPLGFAAVLGSALMARQIFDSSNPGVRRVVYGVALALSACVPLLLHGSSYISASGVAWSAISVFDYALLLHYAGRKASYA
jgi:hypothetical protein